MIRIIILWVLSITVASAREGCPETVSTATLALHITEADMAFSTMDENAFRSARWTAQRAINCLGEPVQPGQAAAYYRMEALGSFLDQNHAQSVGFFKSMLRIAPHYILPEPMAPIGHPLRVDFEVAQGSMPLGGVAISKAADGVIRVDGRVGTEFPRDRPFLMQHQLNDGRIQFSAVVGIGVEPLPYATKRGLQGANAGKRVVQAVDQVQRNRGQNPVNMPLAAVSAVSVAVAGISYVVEMSHEAEFNDATTSRAQLSGLRDNTNKMVLLSGAAVATALTTGVAAFVVGGEF